MHEPGPGAPGTDGYKKMWMDEAKPSLGAAVPFTNLPFLIDPEGRALVQTRAILRHVGRRFGLLGDDAAALDLILDEASDLDDAVTSRCYGNWAGMPAFCKGTLPAKLEAFARHLERNGFAFMAGSTFSVADAKVYDLLSKLTIIEASSGTNTLAGNSALQQYMQRVEQVPAIAAYLSGGNFLQRPLNNAHAQFK